MKRYQIRLIISAFCMVSILSASTGVFAAPVRLNEVVQVINAKPGNGSAANFSSLRLKNDGFVNIGDDDDDNVVQDDKRVITETRMEIVEDQECNCEDGTISKKTKFPYWALGFAAAPLLFLIPQKDKDPVQTNLVSIASPTPTPTPTATPTPTGTPTPTVTPTPPEPIPEPMTLLLFGTGLAGIGIAARKKFGKKNQTNSED